MYGIITCHVFKLDCTFGRCYQTLGDGYRLLRCFKTCILLFEYKHRHTKYAYLLLHFFIKFYAVLSEDEALRLLNNRFFNYVGGVGNNIPLDLHMEHLNLMLKPFAKEQWRALDRKDNSKKCKVIAYPQCSHESRSMKIVIRNDQLATMEETIHNLLLKQLLVTLWLERCLIISLEKKGTTLSKISKKISLAVTIVTFLRGQETL